MSKWDQNADGGEMEDDADRNCPCHGATVTVHITPLVDPHDAKPERLCLLVNIYRALTS